MLGTVTVVQVTAPRKSQLPSDRQLRLNFAPLTDDDAISKPFNGPAGVCIFKPGGARDSQKLNILFSGSREQLRAIMLFASYRIRRFTCVQTKVSECVDGRYT